MKLKVINYMVLTIELTSNIGAKNEKQRLQQVLASIATYFG